jgi:DNA-binding NarL/FixJ family response regulator
MNARPNTFAQSVKRLMALTERQCRVATLACNGLSNKQIAAKLGVSEGTVKTHLHAIYVKLGVRSRTELRHPLLYVYKKSV